MSNEIHSPHDKGYKYLLSSREIFLELLQSFVDQGWVDEIDPESIVAIEKSFILQDFNEKEADLVYQVKIKGREVIFYILMELQSTVDFQMPYRLLLYMTEIWRDILKNSVGADRKDFRLPAIVPMVLYNGSDNWTAARNFKDTLTEPELFHDYILDFRYILFDVKRYSKESLLQLSNLVAAVFLLDQDVDQKEIFQRMRELISVFKDLTPEKYSLFKVWFKHIAARNFSDATKKDVIEIIEQSNPREVKSMVHSLERIFSKEVLNAEVAEKRGIIKVAKNLLKNGVDIEIIVKSTGLSKKEITDCKEE